MSRSHHNKRHTKPSLTSTLLWCSLLAALWLGCATAAQATSPPPPPPAPSQANAAPTYELHQAPIGWWRQFTRQNRPGVVMEYGEWQRHWATLQSLLRGAKDTRALPPLLQALQIKGKVSGRTLQMKLRLRIKVLAAGWQFVPLRLRGVALASVRWQGMKGSLLSLCPTKSPCRPSQKGLWAAVHGPATGTLRLVGGVRIHKTPQGRAVRFQVPRVAASTLWLQLPGQQELHNPLKSLQLKRKKGTTWIVGSLDGAREVKLLYRPLEAGTQKQIRLATTGETELTLHPQFQWLTARLTLRDRMGLRGRYSIALPQGYRLLSLQAPQLAGLALDQKQHRLLVRLRPGASNKGRKLIIRLVRQGALRTLQIAPLGVAGAYSQIGHINVAVHRSLKARITRTHAISRVPLPYATKKASGPVLLPGAVRMRFRYWQGDSVLALDLRPVQAKVEARPQIQLRLTNRQAQVRLNVSLHVREGRLLELPWTPPVGWQISQLLNQKRKALRYSRQGKQYILQLPKPLSAGQKTRLTLVLLRRIKLPATGSMRLALPSYKFPGTLHRTGTLQIAYPRFYEGRTKGFKNLDETTNKHVDKTHHHRSFVVLQPAYQGQLDLTRKPVRLQMLSVSHYQLQPAQLKARIDVHVKIQGAGVNTLMLRISRAAKDKLQFRAASGRIVEQTKVGQEGAYELWQLKFARERFGLVSLEVQIQRALKESASHKALTLPIVLAAKKAETDKGFVAVSTTPHMRIKPQAHALNSLDPSLLPAPLFGTRQIPVVAYHSQQRERRLTLALRPMRPKRLLTALVRQLSLRAQLQADGKLRVRASLHLQSKGIPAFEAQLPLHSELWGATLNGRGVKPMRQGRSVRIPLPPHHAAQYRISLHYTTRGIAISSRAGALKAQAPQITYPVQRTHWSLHTPADTVAFASNTSHPISGARKPRSLIEMTLRYLRRHPKVIGLLLFFLLLFVLRAWMGRLLGAGWALIRTLLQLVFAFIRYLGGRWYRWGMAIVGIAFMGSFFFIANLQLEGKSASPSVMSVKSRYSRMVVRRSMPQQRSLKDSGGARGKGWGGSSNRGPKISQGTASDSKLRIPSNQYRLRAKRKREKKRSKRQRRFDPKPVDTPKQATAPQPTVPTTKTPALRAPMSPPPPPPAPIVAKPRRPSFQARRRRDEKQKQDANKNAQPREPKALNQESKPNFVKKKPPRKDAFADKDGDFGKRRDRSQVDDQSPPARNAPAKAKVAEEISKIKELDRLRKGGMLGLLPGGKKGTKYPMGSPSHAGKGRFGNVGAGKTRMAQKRQQEQRMLQWMMRKGEGRMMRGIRSIDLTMPVVGARIYAGGVGLVPALDLTLWRLGWLRWLLLLELLVSLGIGLLIAWRMPKQRTLLFWAGLLLSGVVGILTTGTGVLFANAVTLGILAAGLLCFVGRKPDKPAPTKAAKAMPVALLALFAWGALGLGPAPTSEAHAAAPSKAAGNHVASTANDEHCALPFARHKRTKHLQLPGKTASLFVPYGPNQKPGVIGAKTPIFVPHAWWRVLRNLQPGCKKLPRRIRAWQQAHYVVKVTSDTQAKTLATFRVRLLAKGWHRVALGLRGAFLEKQRLHYKAGATRKGHIRYGKKGYEALLQGPGEVTIRLQLRLTKKAHKRHLQLHVGPAQAAMLSLQLPGQGWQVSVPQAKGGVMSYAAGKLTRAHAFLGQREQPTTLKIAWKTTTQDSATQHEAAQLFATTHVALHAHLLRLQTQFAFSYRFRSSDRFSIALPKGTILERLVVPKMRRWYLQDRKDGSTLLTLRLNHPVKTLTLSLQTAMLRGTAQKRHAIPLLTAPGVSQHTGIVGIRNTKGLQMTLLGADSLEKRSPTDYAQSTSGWGGLVHEAYAYRRPPRLTAILQPHQSKAHARAEVKVAYTRKRTQLRAHVQYSQVKHTTFVVSFAIAATLRLHKVKSLQGPPVRQFWFGPKKKGLKRLFVELQRPLVRGQRLIFEGSQTHGETAAIPAFVPQDTKRLKGTLLLYIPKDLEAQTEKSTGLDAIEVGQITTLLDHNSTAYDSPGLKLHGTGTITSYTSESIEKMSSFTARAARLAYQFVRGYQGRIHLRKEVTTAQCEGEVALQLEEHTAIVQVHLRFQATGAGQRSWSFQVPQAIAGQLQWLQKPPQATLQRHKPAKGFVKMTWKLLQPTARGHVGFQYRMAIPKSGLLKLGGIAPYGVGQWKLHLLLKKGRHIRVHLPKTLGKGTEKVSLGALTSSLRRRHRDLIAAYSLKAADWSFMARRETLRTAVALQPAVELAQLKTIVTLQGQAWTQATYTLRSPGLQTITLTLPPKASLWQVTVAGHDLRPAQSSNGNNSYILPLPPKQTSDLAYPVRVIYAHNNALPAHYGDLNLKVPKLSSIDTAETFWTVRLPYAYKIAWDRGNMEPTLQLHIATQQLKQAITFAQKLKRMAAVGSRQQQWRAQRNFVRQRSSLRRRLSSALSAQHRANRLQLGGKKKSRLMALNNSISNLKQSVGDLLRTRRTRANTTPLDPTAHWKHEFNLRGKGNTPYTHPKHTHGASLFRIHKSGRATTYVTMGGAPQLSLTLYRRASLHTALGWLGWLALLLVCLFVWRKWFV